MKEIESDSHQSNEDNESHQLEDNASHLSKADSDLHHLNEDGESHQSKDCEQHLNAQLEDDEELGKESLKVDSAPRYDSGPAVPPYSFFFPSSYRGCAGCNDPIGPGRFLSGMNGVWHPECFRCNSCNQPITDYEFSVSGNCPYHKSCYSESCHVCSNIIPTNSSGLIEYRLHAFWMQRYCPSHENDGTCWCCSCEMMEPKDTRYLSLDDGRKLCLECLDSAVMDTHECQPLYFEIRAFYEGLYMKVEQDFPLLLVEWQALNGTMEGEKNGDLRLPECRGLCLPEPDTTVLWRRTPRLQEYFQSIHLVTEPYPLSRRREVTAILILYGLPRLLTGSILAHEMMRAWLRLKGYANLSPDVEQGICRVLSHMWLDSEIYSSSGSDEASTSSPSTSSSSSSPSSSSSTSSKKGKRSDFEKKLGEFFKHQIESDTSWEYGDGFRAGNKAVLKYGLKSTLDHIEKTGSFPV